jgi:hypothetical protein
MPARDASTVCIGTAQPASAQSAGARAIRFIIVRRSRVVTRSQFYRDAPARREPAQLGSRPPSATANVQRPDPVGFDRLLPRLELFGRKLVTPACLIETIAPLRTPLTTEALRYGVQRTVSLGGKSRSCIFASAPGRPQAARKNGESCLPPPSPGTQAWMYYCLT